jgi:hypothetical protein
MSKGSWRRPPGVSDEEFQDNWRRTFGLETYKKASDTPKPKDEKKEESDG